MFYKCHFEHAKHGEIFRINLLLSVSMTLIEKYFPDMTTTQRNQFAALEGLYRQWNEKINVISRKDIDQLYLRHVLHSLAIARVCSFDSDARILDVGSGGGFPGIPLAILFPESKFTLIDSIGKKVSVIRAVAETLRLDNVNPVQGRAEELTAKFDYVVSRAVTRMAPFTDWVWSKIEKGQKGALPNGILYLKGGDLKEELAEAGKKYIIYDIADFFAEDFFAEGDKKVVYIPKI